jgi:hypothetical protein
MVGLGVGVVMVPPDAADHSNFASPLQRGAAFLRMRRPRGRPMHRYLFVMIAATFFAAEARGQTGVGLLFRPWEEGARVEADARAAFFADGETDADGDDDSVRLSIYESQGRVRLNGEKESPFAAGYALYYLDIDRDDAALPHRLVDQQVAIGAELFHCDGWAVSLIGGLGFASSNPFGDSDALYGRGDLVATRKIDEFSSIQVGLSYDGNRTFLPDIPLPGFAYNRKVSDTLSYTLGLPYSSVNWVPADHWYVIASISPAPSLNIEVGCEVVENVTVYGAFRSEIRAFHIDGDDDHRRVFFEQSLLEVGVRWKPCPTCEVFAAGGLGFDQEFTRGWDTRDTDDVREISDEPYVRVGGRIRF